VREAAKLLTSSEAKISSDRRLMKIVTIVSLGNFMSTLDSSMINAATNEISREFNSSFEVIQWISMGYMLALSIAVPMTGWATNRFGARKVYSASVALFVVGSSLSGLARSPETIIIFRFLQGLGGGLIVPTGMTILARAAGPQRIGQLMGMVSAPMLLGTMLGPIVGGYLVDHFTWRGIFFVNLPVGVLTLLVARGGLDAETPNLDDQLDWKGVLLISPALAILVYSLANRVSSDNRYEDMAIGCAIALTLIIKFIRHARRQAVALIDVRVLSRRTVGASAVTTLLFGIVFFGLASLLPLYFEIVRGQSALNAGLLLAAQSLGTMISTPIAGRLTDSIGPGKIVVTGLALVGAGTLYLGSVSRETPLWHIELVLFVTGLGAGSTPTISAALRGLASDEIGRVMSALTVLLRVGGLVGTALVTAIMTPRLSELASAVGGDIGPNVIHNIPAELQVLLLPALGRAFEYTFLWSFGFVLLAVLSALFLPFTNRDAAKPAMMRLDHSECRTEAGVSCRSSREALLETTYGAS
jgi:EmrB/QacA subfamily drug resistance transporter